MPPQPEYLRSTEPQSQSRVARGREHCMADSLVSAVWGSEMIATLLFAREGVWMDGSICKPIDVLITAQTVI